MATVLVVDDEPDLRELVRINLSLEGHTVLLAADGDQALEMVAEHPLDVILLDVLMPTLDGWEVLGAIKREPGLVNEIPIVMLTARSEEQDRARGAIEGAVWYVTKPFTPSELVTAVDQALSGEPEPVKRRRAQTDALRRLARLQRGDVEDATATATPRLTRLEPQSSRRDAARVAPLAVTQARLSTKQRGLLDAVAATATVREAADLMGVSRSYVYASLRRIARKVGVGSSARVVDLARQGAFRRVE
jgi:DNA-binding response OmpR family regulator